MSNNDTMTIPGSADAEALAGDIERLGERLRQARQSINRVIFGQQAVIDQTLIALLSGGHVLLIWSGLTALDVLVALESAGHRGVVDSHLRIDPEDPPAQSTHPKAEFRLLAGDESRIVSANGPDRLDPLAEPPHGGAGGGGT